MGRKRTVIFPLYEDVRRVTALLSDAQMGKAIRSALDAYYNGESVADGDGVVQLASTMLLEQARRYDKYREQQRGNRTATKCYQVQPNATKCNQTLPSDPPNPNPIPNNICAKAVQLLNDLSGSSFRASTKSTQKLIHAREKDGYTWEDVEAVIRHQCGQWGKDEKMRKYLRPETLFGSKFESYLSDAKRCGQNQAPGYVLATLEDQWDVAVKGVKNA